MFFIRYGMTKERLGGENKGEREGGGNGLLVGVAPENTAGGEENGKFPNKGEVRERIGGKGKRKRVRGSCYFL